MSAALDDRAYQQALYAAAMLYVDQGLSVIPIQQVTYDRDGRKHIQPLIKWVHEPDTLVTRHDQVEKWFGMIGPARGIAIATEPSGLLMVDLDDYKAGFGGVELPAGGWIERGGRGGGHVYFRNPTGARNTQGRIAPGVDTRGAGGLVICAPTRCVMADGSVTQWLTERPLGELRVTALPTAPDAILSAGPARRRLAVAGTPTEITRDQAERAVVSSRDEWLTSTSGTRHAAMIAHLGPLARLLLAEGMPVYEAAAQLEAAVDAHPDAQAGEAFESAPGAIAAALGYATAEPWVLTEPTGFETRFTSGPLPAAPVRRGGALPTIPAEVWTSRLILTHIRDTAWSRRLSPDAVLHATLARLAAGRRASLLIDSGIETSSLNFFAAIIGASGSGKSRAWKLAGELLPLDFEDCPVRPLGSGEGVSEAFMGIVATTDPDTLKMIKQRVQIRHNTLFELDEGQTLTAMLQRSGATIGPALRTAWSGGVLGQQNADVERNRLVTGYATGLVAGFQPDAMQPLIDDVFTGMPQRFAFVSATDPAMPRTRSPRPGGLPVDLAGVLAGAAANPFTGASDFGTVVTVPAAVTDEIDATLFAVGTAVVEQAELDSQRIGVMLRFSGLLALLEGRFAVTDEDWQLAGVLWAVSAAVRDALVQRAAEAAERARERADELYASRQVRVSTAVADAPAAVERVAASIAKRVALADGGRMPRAEVRRKTAHRDRGLFESAVNRAVAQGWIRADGEHHLAACTPSAREGCT